MPRQKSEDRIIPKGRRKTVPTRRVESLGGGKAIPVNEQTEQLFLSFETAEVSRPRGRVVADGAAEGLPLAGPLAKPKSKPNEEIVPSATIGEVAERLREAFENVASNKGAPGPDRQTISEVREHLDIVLPKLTKSLLEGTYTPGEIRRVWIPKSGGGERGLGIPNVVDRTVQEAVRLVLEPLYEPTFREESHGFRPGRSCHTAIVAARRYLEEGYSWVVDLDLEKFFDRVHHQRLLARLSERIKSRELLALIGRMLKAKVALPDGVVVATEEGVPQGGPLSPLLSNIVLDELDEELCRRGHRFVRYADDANIYVRSERAGQRVMSSVVRFIERRLRLKVNESKSAVSRPENRHFLGFSLGNESVTEDVEVLLSERTKRRIDEKVRDLTPRSWGRSFEECIQEVNAYLIGWIGYFGICTRGVERTLQSLDAHIRRRLRVIKLSHWKRRRTIARNLISLGVTHKTVRRYIYTGRKSRWALSHTSAVDRGLSKAYFADLELVSLLEHWRGMHQAAVAPAQLSLRLE